MAMTKNLDSVLNLKLRNMGEDIDLSKINVDLYKLHYIFGETLYCLEKGDFLIYYDLYHMPQKKK